MCMCRLGWGWYESPGPTWAHTFTSLVTSEATASGVLLLAVERSRWRIQGGSVEHFTFGWNLNMGALWSEFVEHVQRKVARFHITCLILFASFCIDPFNLLKITLNLGCMISPKEPPIIKNPRSAPESPWIMYKSEPYINTRQPECTVAWKEGGKLNLPCGYLLTLLWYSSTWAMLWNDISIVPIIAGICR